MKILALMPDAYRGFGGIAQYNRDLLDALLNDPETEQIVSVTRHVPDPDSGLPPPSSKLNQYFLPGSEIRYFLSAIWHALRIRPQIVICGHIHLLPVAAFIKKLTGARLVLEAYGIEAWERRPGIRSWGTEHIDLVIAISRFTREQLMRWSGIEPHRIKIVPNAVHLSSYIPSEKPEYLVERYGVQDKLVLLTVGRLPGHERYKGQDRIIALMPKLLTEFPNLIYIIVGDGTDRRRLEHVVETLDLKQHVLFAGRIPEAEKVDHYNLADAFAMPSTSEGFGFVFLEAAACGVPVLGGGTDGSRDALVDGRLGVVVDPESQAELLEGLSEIMRRERRVPELLQRFDYSRFTAQVKELFESQLENKSIETNTA
jgi:phosphatidyl-myo-inositol dimannoside synthase